MAVQSMNVSAKLSKAYERSKDVLGGVSSETKEFYEGARRWLPEHYEVVAVAAGFGLLGYLAGRRSRPKPSLEIVRPAKEAAAALPGSFSELDIAPFFKFLKLWMLYRVATKA
jgi:hypothetical protein